jgi:hypothetical protein
MPPCCCHITAAAIPPGRPVPARRAPPGAPVAVEHPFPTHPLPSPPHPPLLRPLAPRGRPLRDPPPPPKPTSSPPDTACFQVYGRFQGPCTWLEVWGLWAGGGSVRLASVRHQSAARLTLCCCHVTAAAAALTRTAASPGHQWLLSPLPISRSTITTSFGTPMETT